MDKKSNTWNLLASRKRPIKIVDLPIYENGVSIGKVALRTLMHKDNEYIQIKAIEETDKKIKQDKLQLDKNGSEYGDLCKNIAAKYYLFLVCRDVENTSMPFFPTPNDVEKYLSNEEVALLIKQHAKFQVESDPNIYSMSNEEMDQYIERLANEAEEAPYFLERILPVLQVRLMTYMARQLLEAKPKKASQTDKSLLGLQQSEFINESKISKSEKNKIENKSPIQ